MQPDAKVYAIAVMVASKDGDFGDFCASFVGSDAEETSRRALAWAQYRFASLASDWTDDPDDEGNEGEVQRLVAAAVHEAETWNRFLELAGEAADAAEHGRGDTFFEWTVDTAMTVLQGGAYYD